MGKFDYQRAKASDWEGLTHHICGGEITVLALCDCGASEEIKSHSPIPPDQFAKKFKAKGWQLGKAPRCPACRAKPKKEEPVQSNKAPAAGPALADQDREPAAPSPAARNQRRLIYLALEDGYDEGKGGYKEGHSDEIIAANMKCHPNLVRIVREEFFGPAAPPEPPEALAIRGDIQALAQELGEVYGMIKGAQGRASGIEAKISALNTRLNDLAEAQGWKR